MQQKPIKVTRPHLSIQGLDADHLAEPLQGWMLAGMHSITVRVLQKEVVQSAGVGFLLFLAEENISN